MEQYANYEFYSKTYKGTAIPESAFDRLAMQASFYVNQCCFGRITQDILKDVEVGDQIRRAVCEVSEISQKSEARDGITSEKTGNEQVSYTSSSPNTIRKQKYEKVKVYLADTNLLYKGVYPVC